MTAEKPKIFTREYYQRLYDVEDRHWWCRGVRGIAADLLAPHRRERKTWRVLDAGCGTGVTLEWLKELGFRGEEHGIDYAREALDFCQSRGQDNMVQASVLQLPYDDETFDIVACMDVLQHLPLPDGDVAGLKEIGRVLRPGGLLLVRANARRVGDAPRSKEVDYRRYSLRELRDSFHAAGFKVERLTYVNWLDGMRDRLKPRRPTAEIRSTHVDHGLPLRLLPPWLGWLNAIRLAALRIEGAYLRKRGRVIRCGHSTLALVRKPAATGGSAGA